MTTMVRLGSLFFFVLFQLIIYNPGFWRSDKLRQVSSAVTRQIDVSVRLNFVEGKAHLQECIRALLESIADDTMVKSVNLDILMHTRSEDSRVRMFALSCSEALWRSHGGKLLGMFFEA